jgi:CheY-like chemotaxis protein
MLILFWSCFCRAGLEALSVLRAHSQAVDLVLTDIMMPFLDGFGLLKEIRYRT